MANEVLAIRRGKSIDQGVQQPQAEITPNQIYDLRRKAGDESPFSSNAKAMMMMGGSPRHHDMPLSS
jgi:hypothetical protein